MACVEYGVAGGVAHIELNRPDAANAFDLDTTRELACRSAAGGDRRGSEGAAGHRSGPRFCAGGDMASFAAAPDRPT